MPDDRTIWILTDGKIGDLVQCRGIAARLGGRIEERVVRPGHPWDWLAPWGPIPPGDRPGRPGSPLAQPFPEIVIASGRRSVPYLRAIKRHAPGCFMVFLKDPKCRTDAIDLIWAPAHDRLSGPRVISTDTGPHPFTAERLAAARVSGRARFSGFARPLTGVLLGGDSGSVRFTDAESARAAEAIARASAGSVLVVPSRRTPAVLVAAMRAALPEAWVWDGAGENPYLEVLTTADRLVVTGDSHNMVSEAALAGVPLYVFRPQGLQAKLAGFLDRMTARGALRDVTEAGKPFVPVPVDASQEIADEVARRFRARRASAEGLAGRPG